MNGTNKVYAYQLWPIVNDICRKFNIKKWEIDTEKRRRKEEEAEREERLAVGHAEEKKQVRYEKQDSNKEIKSDGSPSLIFDKFVLDLIKKEIQKKFPNIPLLFEPENDNEHVPSYEERMTWKSYISADSVDGTKELDHNIPEYTIANLGFFEKRGSVYALTSCAIGDPTQNTIYCFQEGLGSWKKVGDEKKPRPIIKKPWNPDEPLIVVASRSHIDETTDALVNKLREQYEVDLKQLGSSRKFCMVAEGEAHIYLRVGPDHEDGYGRSCDWDNVGKGIVDGTGGVTREVRYPNGRPEVGGVLTFNNDSYIPKKKRLKSQPFFSVSDLRLVDVVREAMRKL